MKIISNGTYTSNKDLNRVVKTMTDFINLLYEMEAGELEQVINNSETEEMISHAFNRKIEKVYDLIDPLEIVRCLVLGDNVNFEEAEYEEEE